MINERREFVDGNQAAFELFGQDAKGRDLADIIDNDAVIEAVDAVLAGAPDRDGELFLPAPIACSYEMRVHSLPARNPAKAGWTMLILHDVSAAKQADQMRADFVSNVSHELRSPISSLLGFIETLRGPARDDAEARERFLGIMEDEARRMALLVSDLLTLSKVEADEHIRPRETVDVLLLLGEVADLLSAQAAERGMSIEMDVSGPLAPVVGERNELIQVFRNLADNAINYGRENTPLIFATASINGPAGRSVAVSVTNQGEGFEPEHIPRLTERFYRIDKGRSRTSGGTGLGLAIVKHIVNRHRGSLEITCVPGESATFTVTLPAKSR